MRTALLIAAMLWPPTGLAQQASDRQDSEQPQVAGQADGAQADGAQAAAGSAATGQPGAPQTGDSGAPQADSTASQATPAYPPPWIGLDRLLRPGAATLAPRPSQPGGKDRDAWQREFAELRGEVEALRERLDVLQDEMRSRPRGNWNYSAGGGQPEDPEILKRKAKIKRDRQSLEAAEKRLRELEVEASLAGVPDSWTQPRTEPEGDPDL